MASQDPTWVGVQHMLAELDQGHASRSTHDFFLETTFKAVAAHMAAAPSPADALYAELHTQASLTELWTNHYRRHVETYDPRREETNAAVAGVLACLNKELVMVLVLWGDGGGPLDGAAEAKIRAVGEEQNMPPAALTTLIAARRAGRLQRTSFLNECTHAWQRVHAHYRKYVEGRDPYRRETRLLLDAILREAHLRDLFTTRRGVG